ncbi:uncharacterized protein ACWYII_006624 isoform 2-T7 [Salvelinus alpinus]
MKKDEKGRAFNTNRYQRGDDSSTPLPLSTLSCHELNPRLMCLIIHWHILCFLSKHFKSCIEVKPLNTSTHASYPHSITAVIPSQLCTSSSEPMQCMESSAPCWLTVRTAANDWTWTRSASSPAGQLDWIRSSSTAGRAGPHQCSPSSTCSSRPHRASGAQRHLSSSLTSDPQLERRSGNTGEIPAVFSQQHLLFQTTQSIWSSRTPVIIIDLQLERRSGILGGCS